jgi:hypothetical protein
MRRGGESAPGIEARYSGAIVDFLRYAGVSVDDLIDGFNPRLQMGPNLPQAQPDEAEGDIMASEPLREGEGWA